ncbi:MAG: hypothetical protein IT307_02555 [Chloroflexi bacterium]|nr:hypothetical protein [Chloroflexota bacterium]
MEVAVILLEVLFVMLVVCLLFRAPHGILAPPTGAPGRRSDWRDAQELANKLLTDLLTEEQSVHLSRWGFLDVPSPSNPSRTYRVPRHQGQVKVYEAGIPIMALCVQTVEPVPDGDTVIMHKLMIEGNEEEYLRIANRFEPTLYGFIALRPRRRD